MSSTDQARAAGGSGGEQRAAPQYCPYCGDEDLRPEPSSHRAWHCRSCARVFEISFTGLKLGADA